MTLDFRKSSFESKYKSTDMNYLITHIYVNRNHNRAASNVTYCVMGLVFSKSKRSQFEASMIQSFVISGYVLFHFILFLK